MSALHRNGETHMSRRRTTRAVAEQAAPQPEQTRVRVAIYIRRSTDEDNQPFSPEVQETKLRAYISS